MAYSRVYIFLPLLAVLLGSAEVNGDEYNDYCRSLRQSGPLCTNSNTLIECVELHENWYGVLLADCESLCCDASITGCRINCSPSTTPTTTSTTTTTTPKPKACSAGELQKIDGTCDRYNYCSNGEWVPAKCPIGIFDAAHQSCVFGDCVV